MKLYSENPNSSMHMHDDQDLLAKLAETIKSEQLKVGVETGTYLGLGSTTMIASAMQANSQPVKFVTLEANWNSWTEARENLSKFSFVHAVFGKSLDVAASIEFIKADEAIIHHENYSDVYIDNIENPVKLYSDEMAGKLGGGVPRHPVKRLKYSLAHKLNYQGEDLLRKYLEEFKEQNPLVVLDSAGGVGYMEWEVTKEVMGDSPYVVLLDDTHHLKHFRSIKEIAESDRFTIIGESLTNGWMLAKYS